MVDSNNNNSSSNNNQLCPMLLECLRADEGRVILLKLQQYLEETKCPICHGMLKAPRLVKACMHRFCKDCITRAISDRQKCPVCKAHLGSHRETMEDTRMQKLLEALYGDPMAFEQQLEELNAHQTDVLAQAMQMQKQREQALREQAKLLWAETNRGTTEEEKTQDLLPKRPLRKSASAQKVQQNGVTIKLPNKNQHLQQQLLQQQPQSLQTKKGSLNNIISGAGKISDNPINGTQVGNKRKLESDISSSSSDVPILKRTRQQHPKQHQQQDGSSFPQKLSNGDEKQEGNNVRGLPPLKLPGKFISNNNQSKSEQFSEEEPDEVPSKKYELEPELIPKTPTSRGSAKGGRARSGVPKNNKIQLKQQEIQSSQENTPKQNQKQISYLMTEEANLNAMQRVQELLEKQKLQEKINQEQARVCVKVLPLNQSQVSLDFECLYCPLDIQIQELKQFLETKFSLHKKFVQIYVQDQGKFRLQDKGQLVQISYQQAISLNGNIEIFYEVCEKRQQGGNNMRDS